MTPTEREEFEMVAKAAGFKIGYDVGEYGWEDFCFARKNANGTSTIWNPRTDDGDAFRLLIALCQMGKLRLQITDYGIDIFVLNDGLWIPRSWRFPCDNTATREAIWQCALECARRGKCSVKRLRLPD